VTLFVALLFFLFTEYVRGREFDHQCLWVVRNTITSPDKIDKMLDFALENNFNHLMIQVRGRGEAFYNSEFVPRSSVLFNDLFDPLEYVLKKAHQNNIQIHAWVNMYILWSSVEPPEAENHLYYIHPDWIDQKGNNEGKFNQNKNTLETSNDGEGYYLAPNHQAVAPYLLNVLREIVEKYEIDGLHLDYIRYKDYEFGGNAFALNNYQKQTEDNAPIFLSAESTVEEKGKHSASRSLKWNNYRRNAVTELVKKAKEMAMTIRPNCILSAAVKPNLYIARDRFFQEWDVWLASGYLDWVIPMNYTPSFRNFAANIDLIYENFPPKYRERIIMGISTYNQSSSEAVNKINYSKLKQFPGVSIFSYNVLEENPDYYVPIRKALVK